MTSGDGCFFIGTDTAPHLAHLKEASCGCAGVFGGATALQTYVQVFDEEGALDRFERFASLNGANFYGLPPNAGTIELLPFTAIVRGRSTHCSLLITHCFIAHCFTTH